MILTNLKHVVVELDIGLEKDIGQNIEEIDAILKELKTRQKPSKNENKK